MTNGLRPTTTATGLKAFQSFGGKVNFVAGIIPQVRPFADILWAAIGHAARTKAGRVVLTKRVKTGVKWLHALFAGRVVDLESLHPLASGHQAVSPDAIHTDASPWGLGGVLTSNGLPVAYFADGVSNDDLVRFDAMKGDPALNTLWETIATLAAFGCAGTGGGQGCFGFSLAVWRLSWPC